MCSEIEHLITLVSVGCHHFTFDDFVPFTHQSVGANNTYYLVKTSSPNLVNDNDSHLCCMLHSILPPSTFVCISMETLILLHSCDNLFWCHCSLCSLTVADPGFPRGGANLLRCQLTSVMSRHFTINNHNQVPCLGKS